MAENSGAAQQAIRVLIPLAKSPAEIPTPGKFASSQSRDLSMVSTTIEYQDAWRRFRNLRIALAIAIALEFGPIEAVAQWVSERIQGSELSDDGLLIVSVLTVGFAVFAIGRRLLRWKCPRCGLPFRGRMRRLPEIVLVWTALFLPTRCANCGLPRYAINPSEGLDGPQTNLTIR
jgi:hypothetical protein